MGLFGSIIKDAVGEGISKGIGDAVSKAAEKALTPAAEKLANATAEHINGAAEVLEETQPVAKSNLESVIQNFAANSVFDSVLKDFPKWTYSPVDEIRDSEEDDYFFIYLFANLNDDIIEMYQNDLKANGFSGDFQLMRKEINGKEHIVDFTFVSDSQISYAIKK